MDKQNLKFYFHSLRGDVAKHFQKLLSTTTAGAFSVESGPYGIVFKSARHGKLQAIVINSENDKVKLEIQTYCPVLRAEIESGIQKAVFKKDLILVNQMHQRNLNGQRARFFPFEFDFYFIGTQIKTAHKIYNAQILDKEAVVFETRGTFQQILTDLNTFHKEKFYSLKPIKNLGISYAINWN